MAKLYKDTCKTCKELLTVNNAVLKRGYALSICKECFNLQQRESRKNDPERFLQYRQNSWDSQKNWKLKAYYRITLEQLNKMKELQLNGCAICKQELPLKVDHYHKTGKVRGLLCQACNFALGLLHEDEDIIWNLLEYLKQHDSFRKEDTFEVIDVKE